MAIEDMHGVAATGAARFCAECGTGLQGGHFCPGWGHPVEPVAGPFPRNGAAAERAADVAASGYAPPAPARQPVASRNGLLDEIDATARLGVRPQPAAAPPIQRAR